MTKTSITKKLRVYLSLFPLSWIFLFYLFVLRAFIKLGKMPAYNLPDPKDLGYGIHHTLLFFTLPLVMGAMLLYPAVLFFSRRAYPPAATELCLFISGVLLFMIQLIFDPLRLQNWFID